MNLELAPKRIVDPRGGVTRICEIPFSARRVFVTENDSDRSISRGNHAHRRAQQFYLCTKGSATVLTDHGDGNECTELEGPGGAGLVVPPMTWVCIELGAGSELVMLAAETYDEAEYIRDRREFENLTRVHRMSKSELWSAAVEMLSSGDSPEHVMGFIDMAPENGLSSSITLGQLRAAERLISLRDTA